VAWIESERYVKANTCTVHGAPTCQPLSLAHTATRFGFDHEEKLLKTDPSRGNPIPRSGLVYFSGIFTPERCGDMWGFSVHPILSNPLEYSLPKILYHDGEFLV
jgi:hypothetical protein